MKPTQNEENLKKHSFLKGKHTFIRVDGTGNFSKGPLVRGKLFHCSPIEGLEWVLGTIFKGQIKRAQGSGQGES